METQDAINCSLTENMYAAVFRFTGINEEALKSEKKTEEVLHARFMLIAVLKKSGIDNLSRIARELGKHHSTIANAVQRHADLMQTSSAYRKTFVHILNVLQLPQ